MVVKFVSVHYSLNKKQKKTAMKNNILIDTNSDGNYISFTNCYMQRKMETINYKVVKIMKIGIQEFTPSYAIIQH